MEKGVLKNVLVTGGAGYVGSTLVGFLLGKGYKVFVVDNLSWSGESLLGVLHNPDFLFHKGDITSHEVIEELFSNHNIDAVVHLAGIVGDPAGAKQPELTKKVNFDASLNLLECSKKYGVKRFVYASTCSNYGKMIDPNGYVNESSPLEPVSLYAELKVKFEKVILSEIDKNDYFSPTSLRFATIHGVSPRMRFDLTVNEFTKELVLGRELEVYGEQFWRPYCHVYDIARAVELVLSSDEKKVAYNVFNVGASNQNYQKLMLIEEIKKFIPDANVKYVRKEEDPRDYRVSFEKIKRELGFNITRTVPEGIAEIIRVIREGFISNPDYGKYKNI